MLDAPDETESDTAPGPDPTVGPDADALVLFTSGTTGLPKPVPLTHGAVTARIRAYRAPFDPERSPTTTIMCVPSFHVGGILGLLLNLYGGDTTVVQPRFDAGRWLALVQRHRVTSAFLVPTMLARILDHPDLATTDVSSLRMISYGAAAAPTDLIRRATAALAPGRLRQRVRPDRDPRRVHHADARRPRRPPPRRDRWAGRCRGWRSAWWTPPPATTWRARVP